MAHLTRRIGRQPLRLGVQLGSVLLVAAAVAATVAGYRSVRDDRADERAHRLGIAADAVADDLTAIVTRQHQTVADIVGLFAATENVSRASFARYAAAAFAEDHSRPLGLGFIERVPAGERDAFLARARADGAPGLEIHPDGALPEHAVILYNEPPSLSSSWGFDVFSIPAARAALERSRDTGAPQLTGRMVLAVDQHLPVDEQPAGFALYAPVYAGGGPPATVAERRASLLGWANLPARAIDLLAQLTALHGDTLGIAIAPNGSGEPFVRTGVPARGADRISVPVDVHSARWELTVWPGPGFRSAGTTVDPRAVLGSGAAMVGLLAALLLTLGGARSRAERMAETAHRSLRSSEAELRATLAGAPDLILVIGRDGRIRSASDRARDLVGVEPAALVGRSVETLVPDAARHAHEAHRAAFFSSPRARGMGLGIDLTILRPDGREVPVDIALSPLSRTDGDDRVIAVVRDISARRRLESDQRLLAAITASSDDAVVSTDLEGTITFWNAAAERIFGWAAADAVGRHVSLIVPDDRADELAAALAAVAAGEAVRQETRRHGSDGTSVAVSVVLSPLRDDSGRIVGASEIIRDVSDEQAAHAALETYAAELERSNRDLEEFAYIASHDLSEPLRVVGGYVDLLRARYGGPARALDDDALRYMDMASSGVDRMRLLIEGLLAFSRLRSDDAPVPVDLGAVAATVIANLERAITDAGALVTVGALPTVPGNPGQLTQLMQNLVANAIKFRDPDRPVLVHIAGGDECGRPTLSVTDNGIGIDPVHQSRIFAMFRRLHARDEYEGAGIGLALCRRVADLHGGDIRVSSGPGQGSTFTVTFPAPAVPAPARALEHV